MPSNPAHAPCRHLQMGRRIYLMRHWSPRSDPTLGILLLVLHLTLLLRLALAGSSGGGSSGAAWGFELLPFPLAGAYLAWLQLRMTRRWVSGLAYLPALYACLPCCLENLLLPVRLAAVGSDEA